jgi:predicted alpha/beta hydrolase
MLTPNYQKQYYDPSEIYIPVHLIRAEWDADTPPYMSQTLFKELVNAPLKRYIEFGRVGPG